jgi:hypothetical protein
MNLSVRSCGNTCEGVSVVGDPILLDDKPPMHRYVLYDMCQVDANFCVVEK